MRPIAYEFGDGFRFEPENQRLVHHGQAIPLTGKSADTLPGLIEHAGTLVTKEVLMSAVWPGLAVEENNLNQQISAVRKALGRNGGPDPIETVPRRGYRFVPAVRQVDPSHPDPGSIPPARESQPKP